MLKQYLRTLFLFVLAFSMLSAAVPVHSIIHEHYFVHQDNCGSTCEKHLKNYTKPCCTTSDAVLIGELPLSLDVFSIDPTVTTLDAIYHTGNCFQFFHHTRNKAPPALS